MYFVLYDRFLRSIGDTYLVEKWSRTRRSVDFDDLKISGEQIPYDANPFLVVVNDRQGRQLFSGLASTPSIDEPTKKSTITLKDYMTLFNTEIVVDWNKFLGSTVSELLSFMLDAWLSQTDVGLPSIEYSVSQVASKLLDTEIPIGSGWENVFLWDRISDILVYYDVYCEPYLEVSSKTLRFSFLPSQQRDKSIRLSDFGVNYVEKSFGEYNRATVYSEAYEKVQQWGLTESNSVARLPSSALLVYPAKNRNFVASGSSTEEAVYEAVMGLAGNRYQESIELDAQRYRSITDLTQVDFSYRITVYTENGEYKSLPVGEIETDSEDSHIIRLGYAVQELTQEI